MSFMDTYLKIRALPKTVYFNFKYFNFWEAIKLPVFVSHTVLLKKSEGKVTIKNPSRFGVRIGFGNVGIFDRYRSRSIWENSGHVVFTGNAEIGHGSKFAVEGLLEIGDNFAITAESAIVCHEYIKIGDDVLMSWDNLIMDTDFHKIRNGQGEVINHNRPVMIGNNVWVGCRCTILKGTIINDGNVIAAGSVVSGKQISQNAIIGGNPLKVMRNNISWSMD